MKKIFTLLATVLFSFVVTAQTPVATYEMKTDNFRQIDETQIEWELWIKKASGEDFGLYGWHFQWDFNSGVLNSGEFRNAEFTIAPGADAVFTDHYGNANATVPDGDYFNHAPNVFPDDGESMTLITEDWKHIATFTAQLTNGGDPHNFASADIELAHRVGGTAIVIASTDPHASGNNDQIDGSLATAEGVAINDRELASHAFIGSGDWSNTTLWNTKTTANANEVPGTATNVLITGGSVVNFNVASANLGELTVGAADVFLPTVETGTVQNFSPGTGIFFNQDSKVITIGDSPVTDRGMVVANTDDPTLNTPGAFSVSAGPGDEGSTFGGNIFEETIANGWFYRAYATNDAGTAYGRARQVDNQDNFGADAIGGAVALAGSLTIPAGNHLTTSNLFNDSKDPANLVIRSSAAGTGSLIHAGTASATVQLHIPATEDEWVKSPGGKGWYWVSAPTSGVSIASFVGTVTTTGDTDFYGWDEKNNLWRNFKQEATFNTFNGGLDFVVGRGYIFAATHTETFEFKGEMFSGDFEFPDLSHTATLKDDPINPHAGWHLVGNPYTSAISTVTATHWNLSSNISLTPQFYDDEAGSYGAYTTAIPPMTAFFIQAEPGGGDLKISKNAREHWVASNWKDSSPLGNYIILAASPTEGNTLQRSFIRLASDAIDTYDYRYDSRFRAGIAPRFYSVKANENLLVQGVSEITDDLIIPYAFHKNSEGENFQIELLENIQDWDLFLKDLKLDVTHKLERDNPYVFISQANDDPMRFELRFEYVDVTGIDEPLPADVNLGNAWLYGNTLYVHSVQDDTMVELYDISGRRLRSYRTHAGQQVYQLDLPAGVYVVNMRSEQAVKSIKILVR